jgi:Domain of Unknown Function (DUF1080)/Dolichyl-phosphate-mannose-protein mannosyltransferase
MSQANRYFWAMSVLLAAALFKLWILPLRSSFWVDEMVTAFVVHYGYAHPSLKVAPQVTATIYYWLPWAAERLGGFSEIVYRIPSTLLMGLSLFPLARLAMRLIHPHAGWFVVFAALTLRGFNYEAADARPYALATCVALAAAWFLVRWLDTGRSMDAFYYLIFAALLWRVHLILLPFYGVLAGYTLVRALRGETSVTWGRIAAVYAVLAAALIPVMLSALKLFSETNAHVILPEPPTWREFSNAFKFVLVAGSGAGALLLSLQFEWPKQKAPSCSALVLIIGWWVSQPLALFAFSLLTGNNVFVDRYLSISLPGAALAATTAAAFFVPNYAWAPASTVLGAVVLLFVTGVSHFPLLHHNSNWREAARKIRESGIRPDTPVVYPSPFIEARAPVWQPNYPLPSFLYSHMLTYPVGGTPYLLPFITSPAAERYAASIAGGALAASGKFVIYGGDTNVGRWQYFFSRRSELAGWHIEKIGGFGDVSAVLFVNPDARLRGVASEQDFVSLFDGHTLKGWDGDPTRWEVSDGAIVGQGDGSNKESFLIWRGGAVADFELKAEYRLTGGAGGIQYRSAQLPGGIWGMRGYRADIDPAADRTGGIVETGGRGSLALRGQISHAGGGEPPQVVGTLGEAAGLRSLLKSGDWNEIHIIARGNTISQLFNGNAMSMLIDDDAAYRAASGLIGIGLRGERTAKIDIRNIRLKKLP